MAKRVEETLTVPLPLSEAYQRCLGATEAVPKSKLKRADEAASRVELRTKMSLKSFGEKIELDLSPVGEGPRGCTSQARPSCRRRWSTMERTWPT